MIFLSLVRALKNLVNSILRKSLLAKYLEMGKILNQVARNLITENDAEKHFMSGALRDRSSNKCGRVSIP